MSPHIGLGGGPSEDAAVGVYEGQILALGWGEAGSGGWSVFAKDLIHLRFICVLLRKEAQMNVRYRVELSQSEREELSTLLRGGHHAARKLKRAQILLAADEGMGDERIAATLKVSGSTVYRTKRRFVEVNLEGALSEEPRPRIERTLSGSDRLLHAAAGTSALDPRASGRRIGQTHRS